MADPTFNLAPRLNDSDNDLLRKLLANFRAVVEGTASISVSEGAPSAPTNATVGGATKTVAATGTPEALGVGTAKEVFIYPLRGNTGIVYWGNSSTNDTQHGTLPVVITAPTGKVIDLSTIFLDVSVNGEGVRYFTVN